jgi:hypothetical protein
VAAPQSQGKDVVTIRMKESNFKKYSAIYIVEAGGARIVDIEGYKTREDPVKNFKTFSKVIEEYIQKGYHVESATSIPMAGSQGVTTEIVHDYILVK